MAKKKIEVKLQELPINDKFIYSESIYKIWNKGASLIREKIYSSNQPLKALSKSDFRKDFKTYQIIRFLDLEAAPEEWLLNNGYLPKK